MRLNQFISSSGFCSRRQAERYISAGKVQVNGEIAPHVYFVEENDQVEVDGQVITHASPNIYMMLNKPSGIICTASPGIADNIIDFVAYHERIFPVGRLDKETEGLILLTNDGSIVNELMKEENQQEKEYIVTVDKKITEDFIADLSSGVDIYNPRKKGYSRTNPCPVIQQDDYTFRITLSQGLNRQIRRMCRRFQYTVTHLQRVRIKHIELGSLARGQWRFLTSEEIEGLKRKDNE
ncbi:MULTISPECIES: pseudouridine synthase [unclassified Sporosarcina]|uniref:pseudouridine synthase n=1 Tax=unclassified Sporosarcina TaxID=2647733 RepID=UPI00203BADD9|nr:MULTISPECIES: pseudouridine synthase [unclassified Sporosarcina]GKV63913.1 pseudouridine synthase [Sporosarcina sp. NCCP-2331]GLB54693.1 pseudouridine synthase [Sporosarcina sp. NCCP-2378]